jgi:dipeptidase E
MRFYLSSYKIGNEPAKLAALYSSKKKVGYIPNARDFSLTDLARKKKHAEEDMAQLQEIGLEPELLDLKDYFGKSELLVKKIKTLGGLWISGGNVFILRQAMRLSGLDTILKEGKDLENFVYGGYSAAGCVLSPTLNGYEIVDDATDLPYPEQRETLWEGLGMIDFTLLPHYESDHPESEAVGKVEIYCQEKNMLYKTLKDGEAIII